MITVKERTTEPLVIIFPKKEIRQASIKLPPKEPMNKKAKAAIGFWISAQLTFGSAFIVLLCGLLNVFFLLAGLAAVFAIVALLFGRKAKKEIAAEDLLTKERGGKEAQEVIIRAGAGLIGYAFLILLAILVNWLARRFG